MGRYLDLCGNIMNSNYNIVIGSIPVANAGADKLTCVTQDIFGFGSIYVPATQTLTASSGTSYFWSDGSTGATITVAPTVTTTYVVTVANGACTATDKRGCIRGTGAYPAWAPIKPFCTGFPITLAAGSGATFQWQSTTTALFGIPLGFTNIPGATAQLIQPTLS